MKEKQKKEWIIKYCKNNGIEELLNERYIDDKKDKKIVNFFDKYSPTIQSVCAVLSIIVVLITSLFVGNQTNKVANKQLEILRLENKPIITFNLVKNDNGENIIDVYSEGVSPKSFSVEVATYYNIDCDENRKNKEPIYVYTITDIKKTDRKKDELGKISEVFVYGARHKINKMINNSLFNLAREESGTDCHWSATHYYLVKVVCKDIYDETSEFYYLYNGYNGLELSFEEGNKLFSGWQKEVDAWQSEEKSIVDSNLIRYENFDAKAILYNGVAELRRKKLYSNEFGENEPGNNINYGDNEPGYYD